MPCIFIVLGLFFFTGAREEEGYGFYAPIQSSYNVVLEPKHIAILSTEVTAPIIKIIKKMGDEFEEDELLISLDNKFYLANYVKAKTALAKFKSEFEAKKTLYKDDALSKFELDDAIASVASAEADLIMATKLYKSTDIRAPFKGKVVRVAVEEFEYAQAGKELIQVINSDTLYARFLVPSRLATTLRVGALINITVRETQDTIRASLTHISPVIDPASSTIKIEAEIDNTNGTLWSGMTGVATFLSFQPKMPAEKNSPAIPELDLPRAQTEQQRAEHEPKS